MSNHNPKVHMRTVRLASRPTLRRVLIKFNKTLNRLQPHVAKSWQERFVKLEVRSDRAERVVAVVDACDAAVWHIERSHLGGFCSAEFVEFARLLHSAATKQSRLMLLHAIEHPELWRLPVNDYHPERLLDEEEDAPVGDAVDEFGDWLADALEELDNP